jgi:hypothetical protein
MLVCLGLWNRTVLQSYLGGHHFGRLHFQKIAMGPNMMLFAFPYRDGCEFWELVKLV